MQRIIWFSTLFTEAHKDNMMLQTQGSPCFHAANATEFNKNVQQEDVNTAEALANLSSATAADRSAIVNLTSTNECLTAYLKKLS